MDCKLALMCGTDIPVPSCHITLHQPKIKDIAMIGEDMFFMGSQVLCMDKNAFIQDKTLLSQATNFQIFMMVMTEKESRDKRDAAMHVLQLLFPKYKVNILPRSLSFLTAEGETSTIDENNFDDLQEVFRQIFCLTNDKNDKNYNPANKKAQEIADKLRKARQKIQAQKHEDGVSIFGQYISILTVGLNSMSVQDLIDLTMYQMYDLIERFSLWQAYDIDIRSRLAGAKIDKQPENWMKNIH